MNEESGDLCLICGDKAQGKNFDCLSCQSCKQFFKRHANRLNDWIFTDEMKTLRKVKIEITRRKRLLSDGITHDPTPAPDDRNAVNDINTTSCEIPDSYPDTHIIDITASQETTPEDSQITGIPINNGPMVIQDVPVDRPLTDYRISHLSELEGNKLRELLSATHVFIEPTVPQKSSQLIERDIIRVIGRRFEYQIQKLVQMFRNLQAFH
ncbi:unnamed protein product, partial [Oppiella nova]